MINAATWIKRNMLVDESEPIVCTESGRRLTEPELRVIQCNRRLEPPGWFIENNKPRPPLRNIKSIYERPPKWRMVNVKGKRSPRNSPRKSPKKTSVTEPGSPNYSTIDSGFNEPYKISRRKKGTSFDFSNVKDGNKNRRISITSSSDNDSDTEIHSDQTTRSPTPTDNLGPLQPKPSLLGSFTFPRISPCRRSENIEIVLGPQQVLQSPKLVREVIESLSTPVKKIQYKTIKKVEIGHSAGEESDGSLSSSSSSSSINSSHASFLIADVNPEGVKTQVELYADLVENSDCSDSECSDSEAHVPSPTTRFFKSNQKSTDLEKIVQERRRESGNPSLLREIIGDLESSLCRSDRSSAANSSKASSNSLVKSMINALERSLSDADSDLEDQDYYEEDDAGSETSLGSRFSWGTDSEVGRSTSISRCSHSTLRSNSTPQPRPDFTEETLIIQGRQQEVTTEEDDQESLTQGRDVDGVYWIPCSQKLLVELPRTSSALSVLSSSKGSSVERSRGSSSPSLSPILSSRNNWLGLNDDSLEKQIKKENQPSWWTAYDKKVVNQTNQKQELFKIEEGGVGPDSGVYSDNRSTPTSFSTGSTSVSSTNSRKSKTAVDSADDERESVISIPSPPVSALSFWEPSPRSSITSSPIFYDNSKPCKSPRRRFALKSYLV